MAQLFLCHATEDTEIAQNLITHLQNDSVVTMWHSNTADIEDDSLYEKVVDEIKSCDAFILIWSKQASISPEVMFEWTNALNLHQKIVICQLDSANLPEALTSFKKIPFIKFESGYNGLKQILPDIFKNAVASPSPQNFPVSAKKKETILPEVGQTFKTEGPIFVGTADKPSPEPKNQDVVEMTDGWNRESVAFPQKTGRYRIELIIPGVILFILAGLIFLLLMKKKSPAPVFRATPGILSEKQVKTMIHQNNFYALDWNNESPGFKNEYEIEDVQGDKIIIDNQTGLTWQQAGSPDPVKIDEVKKYIRELNSHMFAGFNDWRLPTLEEAMTLMEPYTNLQELHIDPIFNEIWCIWTADKNEAGQRWAVNFYTRPRIDADDDVYIRACR